MSDAQLSVLNYALLGLVYLFFARVLWAVWSEVRGPQAGVRTQQANARSTVGDATMPGAVAGVAPAVPTARPSGRRAGRRAASGGVPTRLVVVEPKVRKGSAYPITDELTLGRAATCSIGLPDDTFASQLHARVLRRDDGVFLDDLRSTNGSFVNGERVTSMRALTIGDQVQVGSTIFEAQ